MSVIYKEYSGYFPFFLGTYSAATQSFFTPYDPPQTLDPGFYSVAAEIDLGLFMQLFWAGKTCTLSGALTSVRASSYNTFSDALSWANPTFVSPFFSRPPAQRASIANGSISSLTAPLEYLFSARSPGAVLFPQWEMTDVSNYPTGGYSTGSDGPPYTSQVNAALQLAYPPFRDPDTDKYYLIFSFTTFAGIGLMHDYADYNASTGSEVHPVEATLDIQVKGTSIFKPGPLVLCGQDSPSPTTPTTQTATGALVVNIDSLWAP